MNWEAIGAVGEIVAALGVIISLIYLGVQIRHSAQQTQINTKSIQARAYQQLIDHHTTLNLQLATQRELFEVIHRAEIKGLDQLTLVDRNRWEVFMASSLRSFLNGYYMHKEGLISDEQWHNFSFGLETMARRPVFAKWWRQEKAGRKFPDDFADIVDQAGRIHGDDVLNKGSA